MSCELITCPFCGFFAKLDEAKGCGVYAVVCESAVCGAVGPYENSKEKAIKSWNTRQEPLTEPKALTLEELEQMDGKPVWVIDGNGGETYVLVNSEDNGCYDNETGYWDTDYYGMTGDGKHRLHQGGWLAYTHKPKESKYDD